MMDVGWPRCWGCPGVVAYGNMAQEATSRVRALALRVLADGIEHDEEAPNMLEINFAAA